MTTAAATPSTLDGVRRALPLLPVAGAVSLALGMLAQAHGMPLSAAVAMSATTFAGSAQFAAIAVLPAEGALAAIVAGALLNLRYVPMGFSVAPALRTSRWRGSLEAQLMVDESWALAHVRPGVIDRRLLLGAGAALHVTWTAGTAVGHSLSAALGDPTAWGADAAVPAVFLGLLLGQLRGSPQRQAAAIGAVVALGVSVVGGLGLGIAAASVGAVVVRR